MTDDTGATAGRYRRLDGAPRRLAHTLMAAITVLGAMWATELHRSFGWALFKEQFLALMFGLGIAAGFIAVKAHRRERGDVVPWYDWVAAAAALAAALYVVVHYPVLLRSLAATTPDRWIFGAIAVVLALEMSRRLSGWSLVILAIAFILYTRYSHLFPGVFKAPSTEWARLFAYLYLDTNGLLGLPINVAIGVVLAFVLFGRVLNMLGADQVLTDFALALMGRYRGGPAKVAVIASS
ncbi:MAG: TRAP transporter large permease subunit, partial [Rhodospirillaceae bacterium]